MFRLSRKLFDFQLIRRCYCRDPDVWQETLHVRFFDHLKQNKPLKCDPEISKMLSDWRLNVTSESPNYSSASKAIDVECANRLRKIKSCEIYGLVDSLIEVMPERVQFLRVFPDALNILLGDFNYKPDKESFVKLSFYLGLLKKRPPGPMMLTNLMEDYMNKMIGSDMSTMDFAIICTALYKASVRIRSKKFEQRLIQEIVSIDQMDQNIFIAFVKSLRLNRINSPEVIKKLKELRDKGDLNHLELQSLIHTFILIADNSVKEDDLTEFFVERCLSIMNSESRAKDAQKLLYSCALLNFPLKTEHLLKLEQHVMARTNHVEYEQKFDNFVGAALSMWMLNYRPRELVDKLLNDQRFHKLGDKSRIKLDSRKKLLQTCIEIEEPTWIKDVKISSPSFSEHRPSPRYLIKSSLEKAMSNMRGRSMKLVQQIQNLNIAGILVQESSGKLLHVEILDKTNVLSDKKTPNGIIALKLRLLKQMNCKVEVVSFRLNNLMNFLMAQQIFVHRKTWNHEKSRSITQCSMTLKIPSANSCVVNGLLIHGT